MTHIDEHTLELYVLNAPEVESRRNEIRQHLTECAGCRALTDNMLEFHAELAREMEKAEVTPINEHALIRRHGGITPFTGQFGSPVRYIPSTPIQRMRYFIRRHPVATTAGSFALALLLAGMAFLYIPNPVNAVYTITDKNPSYARMNEATGMFEVNNKENETLWKRPVKAEPQHKNYKTYQVVDLNGDGINEVVTTLIFDGESNSPRRSLDIIRAGNTFVHRITPNEHPTYHGKSYYAPYNFYGVVIDTNSSGKVELFTIGDNGRSPSFIAHLDADGNTIGEYWHYGAGIALYLVDLKGDHRKKLVYCTINDDGDEKHLSTPVFIVLDPRLIVGKKQSSVTAKFDNLPVSDAELYYISLPLTDMNKAVGANAEVTKMFEGDSVLRITPTSTLLGQDYDLEYAFDHQFRPIDIKPTTGLFEARAKLIKQGRVKGIMDKAYLDQLKKGIRYWDGEKWQKTVTMVKPTGMGETIQ